MRSCIRPFLLCALAALPGLSCMEQAELMRTDSAAFEEIARLQPPPDVPDAGAVTVLDEGTMEVFGGGDVGFSVFDRHRVIKIFSPRGHRYANVIVPYGSSSIVTDIAARTITPSGRSVELRKQDIFDVSLYPNFVFFSDQRAKIFTLPAIENGSVIEYTYRLKVSTRGLWHAWNFQDEIPVLRSRFTLIKPGEWPLRYRGYGVARDPAVTPAPAGFKSRHVWEAHNVPPLVSEFGMPPHQEVLSRVALAPVGFESWNDVSAWYHAIVKGRSRGGDRVKALADSLTAGIPSPRDRLRVLFEWVRDHVRYIAVEVGIGGYEPHDAEAVLEKRYGDCKDMVVLIAALAARADIRVHPVLFSTLQNGRPDTSLPSPLQFNHLIAYAPGIDGADIWMDATEKTCPFGHLPWYDQGLPALIAAPGDEGAIVETPREPPSANALRSTWNARIHPNGVTTVEGTTTLSGALATEVRHALRSAGRNEQREWLESFLARRTPVAVLDTFRLEGTGPGTYSVRMTYTFSSAGLAALNHSTMILRPGELNGITLAAHFRSTSRTHPVRFSFGSHAQLTMRIELPEGWSPTVPTAADSIGGPFGWWRSRWTTRRDTLFLETGYGLNGQDVPTEAFPAFQRFLDSAEVHGSQGILLQKE